MTRLPLRLTACLIGMACLWLSSCGEKQDTASTSKPDQPVAQQDGPIIPPDDVVHAQYAGSKTCKECHAEAHAAWENSHHGMAEREYDPALDEDAFKPKRILKHGKQKSETFLNAYGLAKILTLGKDNQRRAYPIKRIIGHDPLRQFLIPAPGGRLQTCDVTWDPNKKELFDVYGEDERLPGDWGSWTGQGMNWNAMCASCHNTRLRKNYIPRTNSYKTTMAEMTVSCESCHGPMKKHVEWQKNPPKGYDPKKKNFKDPTIVRQTKDQMLETCAACHARRGEVTGDMVPGDSFFDHYNLTVTDETDIYHIDGQVRDENYVFSSFLSSKMHHAGVRCGDCHEPHTNKLLIADNMLCMRCHTAPTPEYPNVPVVHPTKHGNHAVGSAGNDCRNCHMPHTTYMGRDPRRDHGFTIPDPLLTKEYGTPNACNRCHSDKDADWALEWTDKWYGERMNRPTRTRAILIGKARRGDPDARLGLIQMLKTEPIATWQATAAHLLERWVMDPEVRQALVKALENKSPLVREAALRSLTVQARENTPSVRHAIQSLLDDSSRSVRVAAAWALVDTLDLKSKAGRELVHMLDHNADQPLGRMQLSQFAFLRGNTKAAIAQIKKAIEWDPNSPPFHHDLAILRSMTGDIKGSISALEQAVHLNPKEPEYHYKLGLAWNEARNLRKCVASLENALELDDSNSRAWYNLGLAYNSLQEPQKAIGALINAEATNPNDATIPYARATIHARVGQRQEAIEATTKAIQIRQDYPEAIQLMRQLMR